MANRCPEGVLAEKAGFHSIQVPDRHGRTESYFGSPLNLLMMLAHETEKVGLGAYCLVNTLYHPMHVAEQCAIIDNISRGRLYMTWGRGYHAGYWGQFGIPEERMLGRFLDSVHLIKKALDSKGRRFNWDSDFYQVRDGLLSPNCYQQPRFPFWGSGQLPAAIERCGTYADAWTCDQFPILPAVWAQQAGAYRTRAAENGKRPFIVLMRDGWTAAPAPRRQMQSSDRTTFPRCDSIVPREFSHTIHSSTHRRRSPWKRPASISYWVRPRSAGSASSGITKSWAWITSRYVFEW